MSNTPPNSAKHLTSPTELEKPKFIQLHGRVIGSGRVSNRAAVITLAFLALIIGLIIYGTSQNKIRFPSATTDEAVVIPAAQIAPWWQNQSNAMPIPKTFPPSSPSAVPSTDDSQSVPDLAQIDSADSPGTTSSPMGPARIVSVSAQAYPVSAFPSIPPVPATLPITSATSPPEKTADADEPPEYAKALAAPAVVGVGPDNPPPTPVGIATGADTARLPLVSNPIPTTVQRTADIALTPGISTTAPFALLAGAVLSASLITAIDSDTPGTLLAQVTADVYDSVTGRYLLIPRGSRLIGTYGSRIAYGQDRLGVVWTRLIYPDGSSTDLGQMAGADVAGRSGFDAQVDNHTRKLFQGAILLSIIGTGAQLSQPSQLTAIGSTPTIAQAITSNVGGQIAGVSTQLVQRQLNVNPNLRVPTGYQFNVVVDHDIFFSKSYRGP